MSVGARAAVGLSCLLFIAVTLPPPAQAVTTGLAIDGDADLDALGLPGAGTVEDPYVLAGYSASGVDHGIDIRNINARALVIADCSFTDVSAGVYARNIHDLTMLDCATSDLQGFSTNIEGAERVLVDGGTFDGAPVRIRNTQSIEVSNGTFPGGFSGITAVSPTGQVHIHDNYFGATEFRSIDVENSASATIERNFFDERIISESIRAFAAGELLIRNNTHVGNNAGDIDLFIEDTPTVIIENEDYSAGAFKAWIIDATDVVIRNVTVGVDLSLDSGLFWRIDASERLLVEHMSMRGNTFHHQASGGDVTYRHNTLQASKGSVVVAGSGAVDMHNNTIIGIPFSTLGHQSGVVRDMHTESKFKTAFRLSAENVTLHNVNIPESGLLGLHIHGESRNIVATDIKVLDAIVDGIHIEDSSDIDLRDFTLPDPRDNGVIISDSDDITLADGDITEAEEAALAVTDTTGLTVTGIRFLDNEATFRFDAADGLVYNNLIQDDRDQYELVDSSIAWNVDPRPGTNIIGGPTIGGNAWPDYDGMDLTGDGIGELPHFVQGIPNINHIDFAPLTTPGPELPL